METELIIKDCHVGYPTKSEHDEENIEMFAPQCLNDFYKFNHAILTESLGLKPDATNMDRLHAVLPHIADHYGIDKDVLLRSWVKNYGVWEM